jgi:hypothetical protein
LVIVGEIAFYAFLVGVPLLAAVAGVFMATRFRHRRALSLAGLGLAGFAIADLVGLYLWWENYCWETWQPCSRVAGMGVWIVWVGLGLVLLAGLLAFIYTLLSGRRRDSRITK